MKTNCVELYTLGMLCLQVALCLNVTLRTDMCKGNEDCSTNSTCIKGVCKSRLCQVCDEDDCHLIDCGPNTECQMVDWKPSCSCLPPYVNAGCGCRLAEPPLECSSHDDCPEEFSCTYGYCIDPCPTKFCQGEAMCHTYKHYAYCYCHHGFYYTKRYGCLPFEEEEIDEA